MHNESARPPIMPPRFWLQSEGTEIPLHIGQLVIGRSPSCEVVVDQPGVSRRHARIIVSDDSVLVEDLQSANGVFVNGERVAQRRPFRPGDQVVVGSACFLLRDDGGSADRASRAEVITAKLAVPRAPTQDQAPTPPAPAESTRREDLIDLMNSVAERLIAAGKVREAEAALERLLLDALFNARAHAIPIPLRDGALRSAMNLARATGKAAWVEYVFELCAATKWLLPAEIVNELYDVIRKVPPVRVRLIREYVDHMRSASAARTPAELFVLRRIEGLETLAAAR